LTVDIGAGEAADVDNPEFGVDAPELGVLVADGDVVGEDIAIRVTSGRRDGVVEQEPRPGVGPALHHQQRRALRRALRTEKLPLPSFSRNSRRVGDEQAWVFKLSGLDGGQMCVVAIRLPFGIDVSGL
jgi:uncharacterized membrane protein